MNVTYPMKSPISIYIGEYYASSEPVVIHTVLGSCVAVCLYDPISRIGGMNHILMPGRADMEHFDCAARYGINAMELLINKIMNLGGKRHQMAAKVFGGANILRSISKENSPGKKNVEFILEFLRIEAIRIVSRDLGGENSRSIYFHNDTGEVLLKRLPPLCRSHIAAKEKAVIKRIEKDAEKAGEITLF